MAFSYSIRPPILTASDDPNDPSAQITSLTLRAQTDWALDPTTWDLVIPLTLLQGADAIAQRIGIRFRFVLGEWFLDQRLGVPWLQRILTWNPDIRDIKRIFRQVVTSTPGVASCSDFDLVIDKASRVATCSGLNVQLSDGSTILVDDLSSPFIITQEAA
jgi:hypothetical protein